MGKDPDFLGLGGYNSSASGTMAGLDSDKCVCVTLPMSKHAQYWRGNLVWATTVGRVLQMPRRQELLSLNQTTAGKE